MNVDGDLRATELGSVVPLGWLLPALRVGEESWMQSAPTAAASASGVNPGTWAPTGGMLIAAG